jgi:hypothetical protein
MVAVSLNPFYVAPKYLPRSRRRSGALHPAAPGKRDSAAGFIKRLVA